MHGCDDAREIAQESSAAVVVAPELTEPASHREEGVDVSVKVPTHIVGWKLHRIAPGLGIVVFAEHSIDGNERLYQAISRRERGRRRENSAWIESSDLA